MCFFLRNKALGLSPHAVLSLSFLRRHYLGLSYYHQLDDRCAAVLTMMSRKGATYFRCNTMFESMFMSAEEFHSKVMDFGVIGVLLLSW